MSTTPHLHYLDGWRGLAIACLLIGHFFPIAGLNMGAFGVNLFFVLSGLLMARLLFVRNTPLGEFYRRRIARIFPAVLVFIVLLVLGYVIAGRRIDWLDVAAAASFTNNYYEGVTGPWRMPLGHIWSLCVEEHSYIVLSLIALAAGRKLASARAMVTGAAIAIAAIGMFYAARYEGAALARLSLHSEVAAFGIFASAAVMLWLQGVRLPRIPAAGCIGLFLLSLALHWWSVPVVVRTIGGVGALALLVNLLCAAPAWIHAALSHTALRHLGLWSFSLYVWQQPFYMYYRYYGMNRYLAFALAIACGIASFHLIEQPVRLWLNEHWGSKRAPRHPVSAASV
jgi:peptidoglycan/LPS O-acetylase OafA/YrhL